ncbi:hypothetical protein KAS79_02305 [Candidatus Parcubacteria bacterium]|nr:hypothetical protein [Candidatus Parcubacteria bacterium]
MKNFNNTFSQGGGGDSRKRDYRRGGGGGRQSGNRDRERPQMHEAICSDCGKKCEIPFKPTSDKPVYCSQCFSSRRESSSSNRPERRSYERPRFQDKKMFDATCDKCGKRFELPFRPTGSKPVYCNECFDRGGSSVNKNSDNAIDQYKKQFDMLNIKLDRIISVLTSIAPAKEQRKEVIVKKKKPVKKKVKAKKLKKPVDKKKKAKKDKKK